LIRLIIPKIDIDIINRINKIIERKRRSKNNKLMLGIQKFSLNNVEYIHCPIRKIKKNGSIIVIGKCKQFKPLVDNKLNRKTLLKHFLFCHCKGEELRGEGICNIKLKASISLDDFLDKYEKKKALRHVKYDTCQYCNSKYKIINNNS
jgi:hypothetical protein